jgi:hypothetical protein
LALTYVQREQQRNATIAETWQRAVSKATILFFEWLTPEQYAMYERLHYFQVTGNHTGKTYQIVCENGISGNIFMLDDQGRRWKQFCAYPGDVIDLPFHDTWLAQALAITADEQNWLGIAVMQPVWNHPDFDVGRPIFGGPLHDPGYAPYYDYDPDYYARLRAGQHQQAQDNPGHPVYLTYHFEEL